MTEPRTTRQDAVKALKRELILDAARQVFEVEGLEGASIRAIARQAGYTAGAIYFHFPSKEAIYGAVLDESLDRLNAAVRDAVATAPDTPPDRLRAAALTFFAFYARNPRDLDLGFYLFRGGLQPRGLTDTLDAALNEKLAASLAPIGAALADMGFDDAACRAVTADTFGHAVGLLTLHHTGRIRMFGCSADDLMRGYVEALVGRLAG
ncbi:MAG: hypothetical protein VR70_03460 [Rhodospirillaceae bacterium BRH_c57]|nr:MAG: hypothetical protein VR70_03460 [Rhodospirillaceae bacterium BRH_c57]